MKDALPILYKSGANGAKLFWKIHVERGKDETAPATIVREFGHVGGKSQVQREVIKEGKNIGRNNATTPYAQARSQAESDHRTQHERKGYGLTVAESAAVRAVSPMLAQTYGKKAVNWRKAMAQPKADGFRSLITLDASGNVAMRSREGKPILTMSHMHEALLHLLEPGDVLDGELYIHGVPFQKVASAIKKVGDLTPSVEFHCYDIIRPEPFHVRAVELQKRFAAAPTLHGVQAMQTVQVGSEEELMIAVASFIADGYEGGMLRTSDVDKYDAGKRSSSLLKVKNFEDAEFRVIDVREGKSTHAGMAIFVCQLPNSEEVFDVLSPGTHDEKRAYWTHWQDYIDRKLTVKFQGKSTDGIPRFPVAKAFA